MSPIVLSANIVTEESNPSACHIPRLYDLTARQRDANVKFGLSAKDAPAVAQALY
jgi:DNA topoisomerase IA